jgi:hypothetical protein
VRYIGEVKVGLLRKRRELDDEIESLSEDQKKLKADTQEKKKLFLDCSKASNLIGPLL